LLLHFADRYYPALAAEPRGVETLLVPFYDGAEPVGTVWMVSHDFERRFDREDERLIGVLSRFASAGWRLRRAEQAATTSRRRKAEVLATMAHELRNPFSAILSAAGLLQRVATDDPRVVRPTEVILRQTRHIATLMEDLFDIERIERGKLQLDRRTIDLRDIVVATIETCRGQIDRRGQVLTVDQGTTPVLAHADPVRLVQVLSNLIDNASKFTPDFGLIAIEVSNDGRDAVVAVRDTGAGVAAESADGIFEPFVQLEASGDQAAGGLGLGLALVRRLVALHGGTVAVSSNGAGRGSCFTVRLPLRSDSDGAGHVVRGSGLFVRRGRPPWGTPTPLFSRPRP
jgi:signal transduction histidine kinase